MTGWKSGPRLALACSAVLIGSAGSLVAAGPAQATDEPCDLLRNQVSLYDQANFEGNEKHIVTLCSTTPKAKLPQEWRNRVSSWYIWPRPDQRAVCLYGYGQPKAIARLVPHETDYAGQKRLPRKVDNTADEVGLC